LIPKYWYECRKECQKDKRLEKWAKKDCEMPNLQDRVGRNESENQELLLLEVRQLL